MPQSAAPLSPDLRKALTDARQELLASCRAICTFWMDRAQDPNYDGFLTNFDWNGELKPGVHEKYLNTQARLIWMFSVLSEDLDAAGRARALAMAGKGVAFLRDRFWDLAHGGWYWKTDRNGTPIDRAKLTYGQTFALYATAAYARASGDQEARRLAVATHDHLLLRAADTAHGGFLENLNQNWTPASSGAAAGDRKSLDIHMHVLEAFAELVRLTGDPTHARRLREVRALIVKHMIDPQTGAGGNQFTLDFQTVAPAAIPNTWIAERPADGASEAVPTVVTSYGHNLELAWLLADADRTLDEAGYSDKSILQLSAHALHFGHDRARGGVFREGPPEGLPTDRDKEFWQNTEALVGWLDAYRVSSDPEYAAAFLRDWSFAKSHFIHPAFGEWQVRLSEDGAVKVSDLGNDWKVGYHSGRAARECVRRLDLLIGEQ
jgi:cellobiose epimerase